MSLKHALLGFLSYAPMAGYQLNQLMEQSVQHFWRANLSQIYPTLSQMEREGLLTSELEYQVDRPNRKLYRITEQGREELQRWLRKPMDLPAYRVPFLIQVFFGAGLGKEEVIGLIRHQLELHRQQLAAYQDTVCRVLEQNAQSPGLAWDAQFWDLTLQAGIKVEEGWISWCEEAIDRIERMDWANRPSERERNESVSAGRITTE